MGMKAEVWLKYTVREHRGGFELTGEVVNSDLSGVRFVSDAGLTYWFPNSSIKYIKVLSDD